MSIHELQAALRALDEARANIGTAADEDKKWGAIEDWEIAVTSVLEAARRVAEGAGEPVAWGWPGGVWQDGEPSLTDKAQLKAAGITPEFAYTTPPSADALVEALVDAVCALEVCGKDYPAMEKARRVLAQHKENNR